jgi:hypothetical protein
VISKTSTSVFFLKDFYSKIKLAKRYSKGKERSNLTVKSQRKDKKLLKYKIKSLLFELEETRYKKST